MLRVALPATPPAENTTARSTIALPRAYEKAVRNFLFSQPEALGNGGGIWVVHGLF